MLTSEAPFINEQFFADHVTATQLDKLLSDGWRHFGTYFFRYSYGYYELDVRQVIPLRIRLADFTLSRSQRRTLNQNRDLKTRVQAIEFTDETNELFERHKRRFKSGTPNSIYDFLSRRPSAEPCEARELRVYEGDRLVAVSYFDLGAGAISGIYAMFEPEYEHRRPGIFTMLKEIEFAIDTGRQFYYQGYSYQGRSFYDYKKNFRGSEWFDWSGNWRPFKSEL